MTVSSTADRIERAYRSLLTERHTHTVHLLGPTVQTDRVGYLCLRSLDLLDLRGLGQAHTLLRLLCCLPMVSVPHRALFLADFLTESELFWGLTEPRLDQLWVGLRQTELVGVSANVDGIDVVQVSAQVHAAMREDLLQSRQNFACVALWTTLLYYGTSEGIAGLPDDPACQPTWQLLVPLAEAVFDLAVVAHDAAGLPAEYVDRAANAALHAADHLSAVGSHDRARQAAVMVTAGCSGALGESHDRTLLAQAFAASFAGRAGDAAAACDGYARVLSLRLEHFGAEHPDTVVARKNLDYWLGDDAG